MVVFYQVKSSSKIPDQYLNFFFPQTLSSFKGSLPSKVFFHPMLSSIDCQIPSNVIFHGWSIPSLAIFHLWSSSIAGSHPSKDLFDQTKVSMELKLFFQVLLIDIQMLHLFLMIYSNLVLTKVEAIPYTNQRLSSNESHLQ